MENNENELKNRNLEKSLNEIILSFKDEGMISTKNISDKWHTFGDLYDHRMAFNIALCNAIVLINQFYNLSTAGLNSDVYCYKSKKHYHNETNPMFEDSFIVVIESPQGQISYHYDLSEWDKFKIQEREEPNEWDGHTPTDTIDRLIKLF